MYCPKCGQPVGDGDTFCKSCGAPLQNGAAPAAPENHTPPLREVATAPTPEPNDEPTVYDMPSQPADGNAAVPATQKPAVPPMAPDRPKKKRSKKPLIFVIILILLVIAGIVAWRVLTSKPGRIAEQDQSGTAETVYEDFEVGDIQLLTDGDLGPRLELTITNNTDELVTNVSFDATGDVSITDEYGDSGTVNEGLDLVCWTPGAGTSIAYLEPGENTITLIPEYDSGVVASYTPESGDEQDFQLDDVENIKIEIDGHRTLKSGQQLLTPEECGVDIEISPDGTVTGTITNNSDVRWRSATVYLRAENSDGTPALRVYDDETYTAFQYGELKAEYLRPGDTVDLEPYSNSNYEPARVEAIYVIVEEDV